MYIILQLNQQEVVQTSKTFLLLRWKANKQIYSAFRLAFVQYNKLILQKQVIVFQVPNFRKLNGNTDLPEGSELALAKAAGATFKVRYLLHKISIIMMDYGILILKIKEKMLILKNLVMDQMLKNLLDLKATLLNGL